VGTTDAASIGLRAMGSRDCDLSRPSRAARPRLPRGPFYWNWGWEWLGNGLCNRLWVGFRLRCRRRTCNCWCWWRCWHSHRRRSTCSRLWRLPINLRFQHDWDILRLLRHCRTSPRLWGVGPFRRLWCLCWPQGWNGRLNPNINSRSLK
jgi:hypothetical protein